MLIQGDSVRIPLPDKSVHCVTTSPPYWGLRKYSGEQGRIWGGGPECVHEWGDKKETKARTWDQAVGSSTLEGGKTTQFIASQAVDHGQSCRLCNAWYGGLGLEPTPQLHIQNIIEIFAEVHRVLRDDGVVFLNYGDCYATSPAGNLGDRNPFDGGKYQANKPFNVTAVKQGNLMLMPHRVAIALQDWGWIVRNDLVWRKANPMPESQAGWRFEQPHCDCVKGKLNNAKYGAREVVNLDGLARAPSSGQSAFDIHRNPDCPNCQGTGKTGNPALRKGSWRHTRQHEYVFMLTKKMQYWANQEAVRETVSEHSDFREFSGITPYGENSGKAQGLGRGSRGNPSGRNPRSVLDVPTAPYKGSHYATFPPNLIAPLIRATCPRWACPVCGQGWSPVVEKEYFNDTTIDGRPAKGNHRELTGQNFMSSGERTRLISSIKEYRPTCEHPHTIEEAIPGTVFDPFVGSGTTVQVAKQLLRRGIGLDISMEYLDEQAKIRTGQGSPSNVLDDLPLFAGMETE